MDWHDDVAVARFGLGKWSFVEFLQTREQKLQALLDELHELDRREVVSRRFSSGNSTIYFGPGIADWPANAPIDVAWFLTAPVLKYPFYPVVLDVMESAQTLAPSRSITIAANAIAATWEELELHGLTDAGASKPRWDDVQGDDSDAREAYLLAAMARVIAALGPGFGVILRGLQHYDYASAFFVQRLLLEAKVTGFHVALQAALSLASDPRYRDHLQHAQIIKRRRQTKPGHESQDSAALLLAISPQGLPAKIVRELQCSSASETCAGPAGESWRFLSPARARVVRKGVRPDVLRRLHSQIFDSWDPTGWGYLRRAGHAIAAKDFSRLQLQHTAYNYGLAEIGRDFLYRQFSQLSNLIGNTSKDQQSVLHSAVGAARLAFRARGIDGLRAADRYYRRALSSTTEVLTQADLIYGIANVHARQKLPDNCDQAQQWYERGNRILDKIAEASDKAYMAIRFANGLALAKYHQGYNDEALSLQRKALAIADSVRTSHPQLKAWASPILNANIAKLLEKRFSDVRGAMQSLELNLSVEDPLQQEYARLELARLCFDQQEHHKVVQLISPLYEHAYPTVLDEQQELFGRLIFSISLSLTGNVARAHSQLGRLTYLLRVAGTPGASQLLIAINHAAQTTEQSFASSSAAPRPLSSNAACSNSITTDAMITAVSPVRTFPTEPPTALEI